MSGSDHEIRSACTPDRFPAGRPASGDNGCTGVDKNRHRRRGTPCLWLVVCLLIGSPLAQAERLPLKSYTTSDGLPHIKVSRIVKDSRGWLWFCTDGGLSRFDGYAFTNFGVEHGLPHAVVNDLLETRGGEYWVATDGGLVRFNPSGTPGRVAADRPGHAASPRMFAVITPDDEHRRARTITVLREAGDGTIWAGTNKDLYRVANTGGHGSLERVEIGLGEMVEHREIVDLHEDAHGSLWIATHSGLYRRWPDGVSVRYGTGDGLPGDRLSDLYEDREGRLWVSTRERGFFRLKTDGSQRPPTVDLAFEEKDGLLNQWVNQLFETSDGRFWVASGAGLVEFARTPGPTGRRFRDYTTRNGLGHPFIAALTEDLGGNLWLGTHHAGALKLARGGFTTFGEPDGVESINALFEDRSGTLCFKGVAPGDVIAKQYAGLSPDVLETIRKSSHQRYGCFDGERLHWITPEAVTGWGWVLEEVTLQARSGEWWLGHEGLYRFPRADRFAAMTTARPLAFYGSEDGLAGGQVFRLFEDSRDDIWVSTTSSQTSGLARWEPTLGRFRDLAGSPELPSVKDDLAQSFGEDREGRVWIGFGSGLARYASGRFQFFTAREGLPAGLIMDIHVDRAGRLWLASREGGLVRVDEPGGERPRFVSYTTADGLSSNNVRVIGEDAAGQLYVGGGDGLDRFEPETGRVKHFGAAEGLPSGQLTTVFRDRHGVLWFGMTTGLARLVPSPLSPRAPPSILITGLRVAGVTRSVSALGEREMSLADLASHDNQLQIDFVALRFGFGEVLRYQYRLDGADTDWSAPAEQRTVTYASLAPGRYTFAVRAVNSDGIVSSHPASIAFTILRPVWQRWWFVTLAMIALGLSVHAVYRRRVARLVEMANVRTHIATDLHDDIGANLTRIALLSEVAKRTRGESSLTSIASIARESVSAMSDIVWAINPKRETLLELTRRMRQHAEEVFTLRDIDLRFSAPDSADSLKLGMDVRRDLLLIFKEAVNNAARHSRCSAVEIELRVDGPRLVLIVTDNGTGFDASRDSDGQGLTSMQRRARRLGGTLDVASAPGSGTTVTVSAPM